MNKPTPKVRQPIMDYHEMIDFVEKKYEFDTRDYKGKHKLYIPFEKETGINVYKCPDVSGKQEGTYKGWMIYEGGLIKGTRKIKATEKEYKEQFQEYYANCGQFEKWKKDKGYGDIPYLDYWHWLMERCFQEVSNGSDNYFNVKEIIDDAETPEWVREITQKIYDEFKDSLDKNGGLEVHIEW